MTGAPAQAHDLAVGQSRVSADGGAVRWELAVPHRQLALRLSALRDAEGEGEGDEGDAATAVRRELRTARGAVEKFVLDGLDVAANGVACAGTLRDVDAVDWRGQVFAVLDLVFSCRIADDAASFFELDYALFFDEHSRAGHVAQANAVDYNLGGAQGRVVLEPGSRRLVVGEPPGGVPPVIVGLGLAALAAFVGGGLRSWRRRLGAELGRTARPGPGTGPGRR